MLPAAGLKSTVGCWKLPKNLSKVDFVVKNRYFLKIIGHIRSIIFLQMRISLWSKLYHFSVILEIWTFRKVTRHCNFFDLWKYHRNQKNSLSSKGIWSRYLQEMRLLLFHFTFTTVLNWRKSHSPIAVVTMYPNISVTITFWFLKNINLFPRT